MESQKFSKLNANEVHIWSSSLLDYKNNSGYFLSILSEDERERAANFKFFMDQQRFIITRGILRCLLSKYLRQTPESIEIIYGLWGKPCLLQEQSLYFNVSHSRDYALYAITCSHEVGIDLEYIDKSLELEDMCIHVFSPEELTSWKNFDPEERINSFFAHWVSKEAFLKAYGKGWLEKEKKFTLNDQIYIRKGNLNDYITNPYCFECIPGYASGLFVDGALLRPSYYIWNQSSFDSEGV